MGQIEEYEHLVIKEIASHIVEPNAITKFLQLIGKPMDKLLISANSNKTVAINKVMNSLSSYINKGLRLTIKMANNLCSDDSVIKEYNKNNL
ncbi:MAG TPA: hypothetical protein PL078_07025 [Bacillota bacterium]|nr:hypothetical protein [Peptococcaceae bacterium MAG4]NLW37858.1 hypothetical protein [Peptococcaceae bacterium]HPZ43741.1 hypothetical protein [Bacillota bacterium]HQD75142.1 hypothetical protein [Bacillota bacterium]HUM57894.1 hypothetical protein [Bacillota bacterium]